MKRYRTLIQTLLFCLLAACACSKLPEIKRSLPESAKPVAIARGKELVTYAACQSCHLTEKNSRPSITPQNLAADLGGGKIYYNTAGAVAAANLTSHDKTGIGSWQFNDFLLAIRQHTRPDGSIITGNFHNGLAEASNQDLLAIFLYLESQPPVVNAVSQASASYIERVIGRITNPKQKSQVSLPLDTYIAAPVVENYGAYLAENITGCSDCHFRPESMFAEEKDYAAAPGQTFYLKAREAGVPNLLAENSLANWNKAQIRDFLQYGITADGRRVKSNFCPVEYYAQIRPVHLTALIDYLSDLEPERLDKLDPPEDDAEALADL